MHSATAHAAFQGTQGVNHGIEWRQGNVDFARKGVAKIFKDTGEIVPISFRVGNVFNLDVKNNRKYTRIYVGANSSRKQLAFLMPLLDNDGILVAPCTDDNGSDFLRIAKDATGKVTESSIFRVRFKQLEPATSPPGELFTIERNEDVFKAPVRVKTQKKTSLLSAPKEGFLKIEKEEVPANVMHVMISIHCNSMGKKAAELKKHLEALGYRAWLCTQNIQPGQEARREIHKAVSTCFIFLPLINELWCRSGECELETNIAMNLCEDLSLL